MAPDQTEVVEARLQEALEGAGLRDPRDIYRDRLRHLRENDQGAFETARRYYTETLLPRLLEPDSDPIAEWFAYGERLAELEGPRELGQIVMIGRDGVAEEYEGTISNEYLILYLPDEGGRRPALPLSTPVELSTAQEATYQLLVERKLRV